MLSLVAKYSSRRSSDSPCRNCGSSVRKTSGEGSESAYIGLLEVEFCEAADIANAVDMDSKLAEEVNYAVTALRERKPEDERSENDTQDLLNEYHNLEGVEGHELSFYLMTISFRFVLCKQADYTSSECSLSFQDAGI